MTKKNRRKNRIKLEVIVTTIEEAILLDQSGLVDRMEFLINLEEGGLTPPLNWVKRIGESVKKTPINVMIRPHSLSFHYSEKDFSELIKYVKKIKQYNINGIVFGALKKDLTIDLKKVGTMIRAKGELDFTFHRAIDETKNPTKEIKKLTKYKINSILTSGGEQKAIDALEELKMMKKILGKKITLMPGSGIDHLNIKQIIEELKPSEIHVGTCIREEKKVSGKIDLELLKKLREIIDQV